MTNVQTREFNHAKAMLASAKARLEWYKTDKGISDTEKCGCGDTDEIRNMTEREYYIMCATSEVSYWETRLTHIEEIENNTIEHLARTEFSGENETMWFAGYSGEIRNKVAKEIIKLFARTPAVKVVGGFFDRWVDADNEYAKTYESFDEMAGDTIVGKGATFTASIVNGMLYVYIVD